MSPVYPLFDSIWIAVPDALIPLLFVFVGVLSGPELIIVPLLMLKIPDLIPNADSSPSIYAPFMLYVAYPAAYIPFPVDVIWVVSFKFTIGELSLCLIFPLTYTPTPVPPFISLTALISPSTFTRIPYPVLLSL